MKDRNLRIVRDRREGLTLREIAEEYDLSIGRVSQIVSAELAAPAEEIPSLRQLESDRLDELFRVVWADAISGGEGSGPAQDRVLRIMDRRAKLFGLDFSDRTEAERLRLEVEKVRLMAVAFGKAMDEIGLTPEQRQRAAEVMVAELRQYTADGEDVIG